MTDTRTIEQVVLALAWLAEFPMLQKPCHHIGFVAEVDDDEDDEWDYDDEDWEDEVYEEGPSSCNCNKRGWVPVATTDALLEAGKPWEMGVAWNSKYEYWQAYWAIESRMGLVSRDTKQMALALALEAANVIRD